ncbi:flagella basal body P-ring formation protein FlgA [Sphingobium sp. SCG-1]|uniref:flagella basal body P-ring formation protein FlgA n=1 Tax=Sphingobium sp. SCG-1 TaxID=2072936 RepID=UPI001CB9A2E9|nr:flagella basal body P-ring formation protein FlgA [Sphingobium sp. SCG-1]
MRAFPILIVALAATSPAAAQQKFENLDRLDSLVAMTVGANLGEPGGPAAPIDRRLKLAACPRTASVDGPVFGAAIVKCEALGWRIRVPLVAGGFQANVTMPAQRAVAMRPAPSREMVVKKGDPVQLVAGGPAFSVSRLMVADEDGAIGSMIRVRGEDKKASPVLAQVMEMGMVRIPGFKEN